ncbi:MAG TPA: DUF3341 domain-containing protein [Armatimonadota bacterium]|jgi:hypothetical protein
MSELRGVVGYFDDPDALRAGIDHFNGIRGMRPEVYTPIPDMSAIYALNPSTSGVRWFSLVGGLSGIAAALAMTIWMSWDYPVIVGGKPITSLPPYLVVAFELMVLFGSIASVIGFLFMSRLPDLTPSDAYRPPMGVDRFALYLACSDETERGRAAGELLAAGATETVDIHHAGLGRLQVNQ